MLELLMPIGDRLKELRKASGLTQQALATAAGLSMSLVIHLEAGRITDPRASTLRALAKALGTTVDGLLADGVEEQPKKRKRKGDA